MKKEYVIDILIIAAMTVFLIGMNELGWLRNYAHFAMVPFLLIYFIGKYVGKKFAKKD